MRVWTFRGCVDKNKTRRLKRPNSITQTISVDLTFTMDSQTCRKSDTLVAVRELHVEEANQGVDVVISSHCKLMKDVSIRILVIRLSYHTGEVPLLGVHWAITMLLQWFTTNWESDACSYKNAACSWTYLEWGWECAVFDLDGGEIDFFQQAGIRYDLKGI